MGITKIPLGKKKIVCLIIGGEWAKNKNKVKRANTVETQFINQEGLLPPP